MSNKVRVVKVGGSLLDLPDLEQRLERWLAAQPPAHNVLVVGGGALVEQVRQWHARWPLEEREAHWICIELMSINAKLVAARMPELCLVEDIHALQSRQFQSGGALFDPANWLKTTEPNQAGAKLTESWSVTSDAIAGRLASVLDAAELVLLKSCEMGPFEGAHLAELAEAQIIDRALPTLAGQLPPARVVNLRSESCDEATIRTSAQSQVVL